MLTSCSSTSTADRSVPLSSSTKRLYLVTTTSAVDLRKVQAALLRTPDTWFMVRHCACNDVCLLIGLCCCLLALSACCSVQVPGCAAEFYSYGVLHAAALGPLLLNQELGQLPRSQLEHPAIVHALATARAVRWVVGYVCFVAAICVAIRRVQAAAAACTAGAHWHCACFGNSQGSQVGWLRCVL
jgi:hypothetical protein